MCGKCGGNNSTCLDCAGVPKGPKETDLCGNCLLPSDARFNSGCLKLGAFSPTVSYKDDLTGTKVTITTSGTIISATCDFVDKSSNTK